MEFKGTKGKWESKIVAECNSRGVLAYRVFSDTQNSAIDKGVCRVEVNSTEDKYNALLISKAPEMLQALQDSIDELREVGLTQMADYHERLIKQATEL